MDELIIIFTFVLIISSVSLGVGSWFYKQHIGYKERKDAIERENNGSISSASAEKIAKLEDRVRFLERLATDRSPDLASQIEDLRGLPDVDLSAAATAPASREKVQ